MRVIRIIASRFLPPSEHSDIAHFLGWFFSTLSNFFLGSASELGSVLADAGGKSTGPRTPEGLERSRRARLVHGYYTAEAKAARAEARRTMRALQLLLREANSE